MAMSTLTILQISQVLIVYSCVTILIPALLLRKKLERFELPERLIGYFLAGNFYIINLVFLLQFLHISNPITLWIATILPLGILIWRNYRARAIVKIDMLFQQFLHILKGELGIKTLLVDCWNTSKIGYSEKNKKRLKACIPDICLTAAIVVGILYLYGCNTITVWGYQSSDAIVHNLWINEMDRNQIFSQGVYPHGFHCMIYYLHEMFGIKTYVLLRVFCVTQTIFIHLALLVSLKVICRNKFAPYFGVAGYLLLNIYNSGTYIRFESALPQEYGILFILPAGVMAIRFFQEYTAQIAASSEFEKKWRSKRVKGYLAAFIVSFSLTLAVHFYDTIPTFILCIAIAIAFGRYFIKWKYFWRIMLAGVVSIVLAVAPMAIGVAMGHPLQGSLYWAIGVVNGNEITDTVTKIVDKDGNVVTVVGDIDEELIQKIQNGDDEGLLEENQKFQIIDIELNDKRQESSSQNHILTQIPARIHELFRTLKIKAKIILVQVQSYCTEASRLAAVGMAAAIVGLMVIGCVVFVWKRVAYARVLLSIGIYMLFLCVMQSLSALGLPEIMQASRISIYFCYSLGLVWGLLADVGADLLRKLVERFSLKRWMRLAISVMVMLGCSIGAIAGNLIRTPVESNALEKNEAILCLTNIIRENKKQNWTLVSANDEHQMIEGTGWHYEMITFLRQLMDLKKNPVTTIPTEYVYFFIEKEIADIDSDGVVSEKSFQSVSKIGASQPISMLSGTQSYLGKERWNTMSHMYYWAQEFQKLYPEDMEIYYETDEFVCYRLHQNVDSLYNLAIDYGYNDPAQKITKEAMNGFAKELRNYYDYHGNRLFLVSTFEYSQGEME